jgi:hypothetical protein
MKNRIKYREISPGVFRSAKNFTSAKYGSTYRVIVDENTMTYRIVNINQRNTVKSSEKDGRKTTNTRVLRNQAKKALKELGVNFEYEVRDTNND